MSDWIKIKLKSKKGDYYTLVDKDVYEKISPVSLFLASGRYAACHINNKLVYLHRVITGLSVGDGKLCDHINGNTLDNRKSNLRVCTNTQNSQNRKVSSNNKLGIKGVRLTKDNAYSATISISRKRFHLGSFKSPEEAATAYDKAASKLHGKFARLNSSTNKEKAS